jgi:vacuolar-type H+-ATPase subunit F/Vma7
MEITAGAVVALGEGVLVAGFALAGARSVSVATADDVRSAWRALPGDVALVVLTPMAAEALGDALDRPGAPLWVVMP